MLLQPTVPVRLSESDNPLEYHTHQVRPKGHQERPYTTVDQACLKQLGDAVISRRVGHNGQSIDRQQHDTAGHTGNHEAHGQWAETGNGCHSDHGRQQNAAGYGCVPNFR